MSKTDYRVVGNVPVDLADGSVVEPLAKVSLSEEDVKHPHNAVLISEGRLIEIEAKKPAASKEGASG